MKNNEIGRQKNFLSLKGKVDDVKIFLKDRKNIEDIKSNVKAAVLGLISTSGLSVLYTYHYKQLHNLDTDILKIFENLTPANHSTIVFSNIYGMLYIFTPKKIKEKLAPVSNLSFGGFATVNWGLFISNFGEMSALGYLTAAIWGSVTLIINLNIGKKINNHDLIPGGKENMIIYLSKQNEEDFERILKSVAEQKEARNPKKRKVIQLHGKNKK